MTSDEMAALRDRQAQQQDAHVRRCYCCGSWAWAADDCPGCTAPADRTELHHERRPAS